MTRREVALTPVAAAAAPPQANQAPADDLKAAQEGNRRTSELLAKIRIPIETEPAFQFKA